MRRFLSLLPFLFFILSGRSQSVSKDPLGPAFRVDRIQELSDSLSKYSVAVIFSGGYERATNGSQSPEVFTANPAFRYLTGLNIPDAILVVAKDSFQYGNWNWQFVLFAPGLQQWEPFLSGDIRETLSKKNQPFSPKEGLTICPLTWWEDFCRDALASELFESIYTYPHTWADFPPSGLSYNYLMKLFHANLTPGYPIRLDAQYFYERLIQASKTDMDEVVQEVRALMNYRPELKGDPILREASFIRDMPGLVQIQAKLDGFKLDVKRLPLILGALRSRMDQGERLLLRKASSTAVAALRKGMELCEPGNGEFLIEGAIYQEVRRRNGRLDMPVKVASGKNSAFPYYAQNHGFLPAKGIVVLDCGVSLDGYTVRVSRTMPVGGSFNPKVKQVYALLQQVHEDCLAGCRAGASVNEVAMNARDLLGKRLLAAGLVKDKHQLKKLIRINSMNQAGMDIFETVPGPLNTGMAIQVESAIYFPKMPGIAPELADVGLEIRDVAIVGTNGPEVLDSNLPREVVALEALVPGGNEGGLRGNK